MPAPSLCIVSGVVYDENGVPAVGVTLFLKRVLLNGVLIGTAPIGTANIPGPSGDNAVQYIEAITSIAGGVVSFTVPQLSTVYLEGNVSGYNNGEVALSIPATATSTLEALTPATFPIDVTTFTFLSLVDTPDDFTGDALKVARVNAAETAIEFATISVSVTAEEIQDALVSFFPDVAPFDWTYDDAGDRVTLAILDATASARGLMSTAYATRLDQLEVGDAPTFAGLNLGGDVNLVREAANTLALRNGTTAQTAMAYQSFTDTSNFKRIVIAGVFSSGNPGIYAEGAGTGANPDLYIGPLGSGNLNLYSGGIKWKLGNSGHFLANTDNVYDIGALAATRPRTGYFGTSLIAGGSGGVGVIPLIAEGPAGQTANLFEARVNALPKLIVTAAAAVQSFNAYTDVNNYERVVMMPNGGFPGVYFEKAGTGAVRDLYFRNQALGSIRLGTNGTDRWIIDSSGHLLTNTDNTHDIGASGATRPRNIYAAGFIDATSIRCDGSIVFDTSGTRLDVGFLGGFTAVTLASGASAMVQVGGITSAFPALKRSTTELQARLADDSGDATLKGRLKVHANAVAETPTATHTLRLFDAAGTEYKVLCIAA